MPDKGRSSCTVTFQAHKAPSFTNYNLTWSDCCSPNSCLDNQSLFEYVQKQPRPAIASGHVTCELITLWLPVAETHTQEEDYFPSITVTLTYNQPFLPVSTSLSRPPPTFPLQPSPTPHSCLLSFSSFFSLAFSLFFFNNSKSSFQVQPKLKGEKVKKVSWLWLFRKG